MSKDKKDEKESMGKLEELFLKSRTIMLYGEINQKVAREFCTKIQILAAESDDNINVFGDRDVLDLASDHMDARRRIQRVPGRVRRELRRGQRARFCSRFVRRVAG